MKPTEENRDGGRIASAQRRAGFCTFFLSGICAISTGVVVSLLQDQMGFDYSVTGVLLALFSIGNLAAGFMTGILPGKIGMKATAGILCLGYGAGYLIMANAAKVWLLYPAFFLVGIAKGCVINLCTILVSNNSKNRAKGMNLLHSFYATGALLCPFLIAQASEIRGRLPMLLLSALGLLLWSVFFLTPMERAHTGRAAAREKTDWSFLREKKFWLLTAFIFCQNAAETSVTGWMVTYFKDSGILTGLFSAYTVSVMWGATLAGRLLIAFVFPIRHTGSALTVMGIGCSVFYAALILLAGGPVSAILLLTAFSLSMAGMNPTATAAAGKMTTVTSIGVMLPAASSGAILMPWVIGTVAGYAGIHAGMACNIVPCVGMLILSFAVRRLENEKKSEAQV